MAETPSLTESCQSCHWLIFHDWYHCGYPEPLRLAVIEDVTRTTCAHFHGRAGAFWTDGAGDAF